MSTYSGSVSDHFSGDRAPPHRRATDKGLHPEYDITLRDEPHPHKRGEDAAIEVGHAATTGSKAKRVAEHATHLPGRVAHALSHGFRWIGDTNIVVTDAFRKTHYKDGTPAPKGVLKRLKHAAHRMNIITGRRAELAAKEVVAPHTLDDGSDKRSPATKNAVRARTGRVIHTLSGLALTAALAVRSMFGGAPLEHAVDLDARPTRTARFDPSKNETPDVDAAEAGIASSAPSSFANAVVSRTAVDPTKSTATGTDDTYTLEVPVSDFLNTLVYYNKNPQYPLSFMPKDYLYSDLTEGPDDENAPPPPGVDPLIVDGKTKKRIRVIITDGDNHVMNRMFSGLELYVASSDPEEHSRDQHSLCGIAALISHCENTIGRELCAHNDDRLIRSPENVMTESLIEALNIMDRWARGSTMPKTLREALITGNATPPKWMKDFRKKIASGIPDVPLDSHEGGFERMIQVRKDIAENAEALSPFVDESLKTIRKMAELIAKPTLKRTQNQSNSR